jgi:hypothetical protein
MYADNCGGQNKNRYILALMAYVVQTTPIEKIALCFLEKGHTQNENDSVHSTIEQARRNLNIFVPEQYFSLVRGARRSKAPYEVHEMDQSNIFDLKKLASQIPTTLKHGDGEKVRWRDVRQIAVAKNEPTKAYFAYRHTEVLRDVQLFRRSRKIKSIKQDLSRLYTNAIPITTAKYKDLMFLCQEIAIPKVYHPFYETLPHAGNATDASSDSGSDND